MDSLTRIIAGVISFC